MAAEAGKKANKYEQTVRNILRGDTHVNRLDKKNELLFLAGLFIIVLLFILVFSIMGNYNSLFILFLFLGAVTFVVALLTPLVKIFQFNAIRDDFKSGIRKALEEKFPGREANDAEVERLHPVCMGVYFSSLPRMIMSIGVIPMIFSIVGIILSVEHNPPKIPIIKINPLTLLIILGGVTEAIAFFFGYVWPEEDIQRNLLEGVGEQDVGGRECKFDAKKIEPIIAPAVDGAVKAAFSKVKGEITYK